jgi:tellurite methyltransferase
VSLEEWNQRYRAREEISHDPAELLVEAARDVSPGRALDLACGAGRNALWLHQHGWSVTAVDGAEEAIRLVHELEPEIDAQVLDLERDEPLPFENAAFDLVANLYYLHRPLFPEIDRVLRPGGLLVCAIRMRGISPRFCVAPGELERAFAGYEVLASREGEIAEFVARKG